MDTDRNWDYNWGEQDSSKDPCSDNFAGSHPFSEPETRAVSEFLAEHRGLIKVLNLNKLLSNEGNLNKLLSNSIYSCLLDSTPIFI